MAPTPRPWPENALPTEDEFAEWLRVCTHDERVSFIRHAQRNADAARRCFEYDHEGRLADCERYRRLGQVVPGFAAPLGEHEGGG